MKKLLLLLLLIPKLLLAEPWDINPNNFDRCDDYAVHDECFVDLWLKGNKHRYVGIMSIDVDVRPREANGFGKLIYNDGSILYSRWVNGKSVNPRLFISHNNEYRDNEIVGTVMVTYVAPHETSPAGFANQPVPIKPEIKRIAVVNNPPQNEQQSNKPDGNLPPCQNDDIWDNCHGTYTHDEGSVYVGDWKNDKMHGQGKFIWQNGEVYVGDWKNDKMHGQGKYIWPDGEVWDGEWKENNFIKPKVAENQGGYDPNNEQDSKNPDVDERVDPPKTYTTQNDNELLPAASGSGFAISKDGYVLTNNHVINGCQALNIHTNGKLVPARIIASDPINDLALIKGNFKPQTIFYMNPNSPKLTDDILVGGYPFGYAISSSIKITNGIVSSLSGLGNNFSQMQITNAIQPGNSGGPVVDKKGNVVGIAVSKLDMQAVFEDFGVIPENTNFAIKSSTARSFVESNNVSLIKKSAYKGKNIGSYIENGTYYLSCMMTMARIKEMETQKVFFQNIFK